MLGGSMSEQEFQRAQALTRGCVAKNPGMSDGRTRLEQELQARQARSPKHGRPHRPALAIVGIGARFQQPPDVGLAAAGARGGECNPSELYGWAAPQQERQETPALQAACNRQW